MSLSGTIANDVLTVRKIYDRAFNRAGIPQQTITAEYLDTAKQLLGLTLASFSAAGAALFIEDFINLGMEEGVYRVNMPNGTISVTDVVLNMLEIEEATTLTAQGINNLNWKAQLDNAFSADYIGFKASSTGNYILTIQESENGTDWTEIANVSMQVFEGKWNWIEIEPSSSEVAYFRIVSTTTPGPLVTAVCAAREGAVRQLASIPPDDYAALPNKRLKGTVTSYWNDRRVGYPVLHLWHSPDAAHADYMLTVRRKRHIMDVGDMTNYIEVPQRWADAIIWDLAWRLAVEIPEAKRDPMNLKALANDAKREMGNVETDNSTLSMLPDISAYTR